MNGPRQVWKFDLGYYVTMPRGAEVIAVDDQRGSPCLWALVEPTEPLERREFVVAQTGQDLDERCTREAFVGTFQQAAGSLVFHVFEVTRREVAS